MEKDKDVHVPCSKVRVACPNGSATEIRARVLVMTLISNTSRGPPSVQAQKLDPCQHIKSVDQGSTDTKQVHKTQ